jgi:NADH:ubiquinone oxidoreductase subunit 3 (subunit A)
MMSLRLKRNLPLVILLVVLLLLLVAMLGSQNIISYMAATGTSQDGYLAAVISNLVEKFTQLFSHSSALGGA